MNQHRNDSLNIKCENKYKTPLAYAIRKYGWENFSIEILEENESSDIINELEKFYIKKFNTYGEAGYNASYGGEFGYDGRTFTSKTEDYFDDLIEDLRTSKSSIKEIAKKYNLSASYVSDINNGSRLYQDTLNYPIRKPPESKIIGLYPDIISDLLDAPMSMRQIAQKYNVSLSTIESINKGNKTAQQFHDKFPIR